MPGNIRKIATHLGKDLSDDVIATIAEHVTFGGMQKSYQKIEEEQGEEGKELTRMFGVIPYLNKGINTTLGWTKQLIWREINLKCTRSQI